MSDSAPPNQDNAATGQTDPKAVWDRIIAHQKQLADAVLKMEGPLTDANLKQGLSNLHINIAALAEVYRNSIPDPRLEERRLELTKVRVAALYEESINGDKYVVDFALLGLRSLFLANAGAMVAMLAFVANYHGTISASAVQPAFFCFAVGLILTLAAIVGAYLAQSWTGLASTAGADKIYFGELRGQHEVEGKRSADELKHIGQSNVARWAAIAFAIAAALAFSWGCKVGIDGFGSARSSTAELSQSAPPVATGSLDRVPKPSPPK